MFTDIYTDRVRSITACAGETARAESASKVQKVYHRVCGGNSHELSIGASNAGLSPRVRGKRKLMQAIQVIQGSITACAGETIPVIYPRHLAWVYHRVCGGNFHSFIWASLSNGLSPRVRGKP